MKILITGAGGFLGFHLSLLFSKIRGISIHATYNKTKPVGLKKNIKLIKVNLCKIDFKDHYDVVVHCASKTRVNSKNNKFSHDENINAIKEILKKISFDKFYFMSSNSVYGEVRSRKINEKTKLNARDFYGKSKIKCEYILKNFSKKNKKKVNIFRLPAAVGLKSHSNFISNLMLSFIKNKDDMVKLVNPGDLFNNTVHAEEIFKFIKTIENKKKLDLFNIFVLASKKPISIVKILKIFENFYKKRLNFNEILTKKYNKLIDCSKAVKAGFKPTNTSITIRKMLIDNNVSN